ncbi:MAG: hypothetical protein E7587_08380 [Ruminococcaceae bacterium]|nr:hypothetical protein [Oscillospiraceae bacterium]
MKTRLISFLLLLALVVTAMPLVSFAAENEETAVMEEADYNALYVRDGLAVAFDVMVLNEHWGEAVDDRYTFPTSPMFNDNYEYPAGSGIYYDFTNETYTDPESGITYPYNAARYDATARTDDTDGKVKGDGTAKEYHVMVGIKGNGAYGYGGFSPSAFNGTSNTYATLAEANAALEAQKQAAPANDYWIVGDDTSAAYQAAVAEYQNDVRRWLAYYTWVGGRTDALDVTGFRAELGTAFRTRVRDSRMVYSAMKAPEAGVGYLIRQLPYCTDNGFHFNASFPAGATRSVELVTKLVSNPASSFMIFGGLYPVVSSNQITGMGISKDGVIYFDPVNDEKGNDVATVDEPLVITSPETIRATIYNSAEADKDTVLWEQGEKVLYSATGTYNGGGGCSIGWSQTFKNGEIYAFRLYSKDLSDSEKAQNHFADIAKWFKLDLADFAANRDKFTAKALDEFYGRFAKFDFESSRDDVVAAAEDAYYDLSHIDYPELTLDYYNTLYAETDKLITAFDIMALNEHWGMAVNENKGNVGFPESPMLDKAFAGTYEDYNAEKVLNETTGEYEYPSKSTWDFTKKATITIGGKEVEIPYYKDRFDPRARYDYVNADAAKADKKEGCYGALIPAGDELEAVNGGHEFEYHIMRGTYNAGAANGITAYVGATNNSYAFADTEYYTLEDAYNALLGLAVKTEDGRWVDNNTQTTYEYWIVGDDTSAAYQRALTEYASDVKLWLAQYTWKGSVTSNPAYPNTGYYMRLSNVFAAYDFAKDPVAGVGYLTSQYPYVSSAGLYFGAGSAIAEGGTKTLEMVTRMVHVPTKNLVILDNNRPTGDGTHIISGGTNFPAENKDADVTVSAVDANNVDTFRFVIFNDTVINNETQAKGDRLVLEQGDNILYSATGTYTYGETNMIGYNNALTDANIYNLRIYNTELSPVQKKQNNFVDVAKWNRLDITGFENFSESDKERFYNAFAGYNVDTESRYVLQDAYDAIASEIAAEQYENVLDFLGYQAKTSGTPGLRSTYAITKDAIDLIETAGKKVIVGAIMALAGEDRAAHEALAAPVTDGEYDRSKYDAETYKYTENGVSYQEVYNSDAKETDGVVANTLKESPTGEQTDEDLLWFAFTTIYSEANQTVEFFTTELLYRGFVVILDKDGNTEEIIYADMTSENFDKDDDSISIYELSSYINDPENEHADAENEQIVNVVTAVETAPESYYDLFVTDKLIYHANFASATDDIVIAPAAPDAELAASKYKAATSTFEKFYTGRKAGVKAPLSGGTATISEGGWTFVSPYRYSYWFNDAAEKLYHTSGSRGKVNFFVTETDLTQVPKIDGSGNVIEGEYEAVNYYLTNGVPTVNETNTYGGVSATTYKLKHKAPDWATGFYITDGTWGVPAYSSAFGNGYFDAKKGNDIKPFDDGVMGILKKASAYSVELVASAAKNQGAAFFIGPRLEFSPNADSVAFTGTSGYEMLASDSGYQSIIMGFNGQKINTYSMTFNLADIANYNYTLNAYGNGKNFSTQTLKSTTKTFSVTGTGQYMMRGNGLYTYAFRVYEKVLSADEVLQNHFADIAIINKLNVKAFRKLTEDQKRDVYEAFENVAADSMSKDELQTMLDEAVIEAKTPAAAE